MRSRLLLQAPLGLLLLLMALPSALADTPEADGGKAYSREQLIREARRMARPDAVVATDLEALKAALAEDMKLRAGWRASGADERALLEIWDGTIAARRLLLGEPASVDGEGKPLAATDGALVDARNLLRWLLADVPQHKACGAMVNSPTAPAEGDRERDFTYPFLPTAPTAPATPATPEAPAPTTPAPTTPAPAATAAPTLDAWARAVRDALGGSLLGKEVLPAVCEDVWRLLEAEKTPTPIRESSVPGLRLRRNAMETADPFAYNAAVVALRKLQAAERVEAFRADRPAQGLVDDSTVREKVLRAEGFAERLAALEKQSSELVERLDAMGTDLDNWKTMAAILSVRIEDRRAKLAAATPQPPPNGQVPAPPDLLLRVLAAQETTVALEMRLLYLAAVRADVRLGVLKGKNDPPGLLEQLIQSTRDELAGAQAARALYEEELARVRRERRLDRLQGEARPLKARMEAMGDGTDLSPDAALRIKGYQSLLDVNALVQQAVRSRRALGEWATEVSVKNPTDARAEDAVSFARDPATAVWDTATLGRWRELLVRPAFDAALVAEHYAVAESKLRRLRSTVRKAVDASALRDQFVTASEAATRALAPLAERGDWALRTYRLPELLEAWRRDFDDALSGMEKERERITERQAAIRAYQQALLALGSRSFGIRVVSDLDAADLAAAANDTLDGAERTGDWLLLEQPEQNAWVYARDHWLGLLGVLATLVLVIRGTPPARRGIDRWLARRAARIPQLEWAGASVSRERQDAKARKEKEEQQAAALRKSAEAEVQATAPPEPAAQTAPDAPAASTPEAPAAEPQKRTEAGS